MLMIYDDIIADMLSHKKVHQINQISLAFTTQSYFAVQKNIRLNSKQYLL